jgi:hypothetical protein
MGNEEDARILALEQELAGSDTGSNDDKAAKARKEAKAARKAAKAARKEAAAGSTDAAAAGSADAAAAGSADAAAAGSADAVAAGSADAAAVTAPVTTARMFSVHAGETVHFSGRKPGDPKPKRGAKKRAREAAEDAPAPPPRWRCELCNIEVNSQDLLEEHREGWRHAEMVASKAARAAGLYCEVCATQSSNTRGRTHCSLPTGRTLAEATTLHQHWRYAKRCCSRSCVPASTCASACCAGVLAGLHRAGADGRASQRRPPRSRCAWRWKGWEGKGREGQQGWQGWQGWQGC